MLKQGLSFILIVSSRNSFKPYRLKPGDLQFANLPPLIRSAYLVHSLNRLISTFVDCHSNSLILRVTPYLLT